MAQEALAEEAQLDASDPYAADPPPHPALLLRARKPCTAETPRGLLTDSWITPADLWYIRSHHPVPTVDPTSYRLEVSGPGLKTLSLSLEDLKTKFPRRRVVATTQARAPTDSSHACGITILLILALITWRM